MILTPTWVTFVLILILPSQPGPMLINQLGRASVFAFQRFLLGVSRAASCCTHLFRMLTRRTVQHSSTLMAARPSAMITRQAGTFRKCVEWDSIADCWCGLVFVES